MRVVCCNAAMSFLGQKWHKTNRSLGSRRSAGGRAGKCHQQTCGVSGLLGRQRRNTVVQANAGRPARCELYTAAQVRVVIRSRFEGYPQVRSRRGARMRRRDFIFLFGGIALSVPSVARTQEPGRTYRIALVSVFCAIIRTMSPSSTSFAVAASLRA
jgi:hypothetical protein